MNEPHPIEPGPPPALAARARRAYELGRVRAALRAAAFVLPMIVVSLVWCDQPAVSLAAGAALLVAAVGMRWRGGAYARSVWPGLMAGVVPLALPLWVRMSGHLCFDGACRSLCLPVCLLGGMVAGAFVAVRAVRVERQPLAFLACAGLVAGLAGSLGCVVAGAGGILGMVVGVLAGCAPVLVAAQLRR